MQHFEIPTQAQQSDFLVRLHFGSGKDYLGLCIDKAYLDLSRTLHGIGKLPRPEAIEIYNAAKDAIRHSIESLKKENITRQDDFDKWHERSCLTLCALYERHGYKAFSIGQGQKWINMVIKYIYVLGETRLENFAALYSLCHVPLDNIIVAQFAPYNSPTLTTSWSRLQSYAEYASYQHWIRTTFAGSAPLSVEFFLWQA